MYSAINTVTVIKSEILLAHTSCKPLMQIHSSVIDWCRRFLLPWMKSLVACTDLGLTGWSSGCSDLEKNIHSTALWKGCTLMLMTNDNGFVQPCSGPFFSCKAAFHCSPNASMETRDAWGTKPRHFYHESANTVLSGHIHIYLPHKWSTYGTNGK